MNSGIISCVVPTTMGHEWIEALLEEYDNEAKEEATWPIILLNSSARKLLWYLCSLLGIYSKDGIPASACRLMERYMSSHIRKYLADFRNEEEWEQHRLALGAHFYILAVSCIQLAAKMANFSMPLTTSVVHSVLLQEGIQHTKAEIIKMEFIVFKTLDFRIPLWTSLECAQFFACYVGINAVSTMEAVALIIDLTEFHRDLLQGHMRSWYELSNTPTSSSSNSYFSLHTLHICAGSVCAAVRYLRMPRDLVPILSVLIRTTPSYMNAITDIILTHIIPFQSNGTN